MSNKLLIDGSRTDQTQIALISNDGLEDFEFESLNKKNLKGNLGLETIFINNATLSLNYEKFQHLDSDRSGKTETFIIKIGRIIEGDSEFAFNFDPLINNLVKLSYVKDLHGFDVKLNSSYNFDSQIPEYGTDIEVSTSF